MLIKVFGVGVISILLAVLLVIGYTNFFKIGHAPLSLTPQTIVGQVTNISLSDQQLIILTANLQNYSVQVIDQTRLLDEQNQASDFNHLFLGSEIQVIGSLIKPQTLVAQEVKRVKTPNIIVNTPTPRQKITAMLKVTGQARVFENVVSLQVERASSHQLLLTDYTQADAPDVGQFGLFEFNLNLSTLTLQPQEQLTIRVFADSPKDGSPLYTVEIPVIFIGK